MAEDQPKTQYKRNEPVRGLKNSGEISVYALCVGGRHQQGYWKLSDHTRRPEQTTGICSGLRTSICELCVMYFIGRFSYAVSTLP